MANPTSPVDGGGYRIGMIVKKVSTTLTASLVRAIATAATSGADLVGWMGVATHIEGDPVAVSDASNVSPVVIIAGKFGSHTTVDAADASAIQADALGQLKANSAGLREETIWPSAARTATPTKADKTNYGAGSLVIVIDITAGSSLSITPTIQGKDTLSGKYYTILAGTTLTGTGTTILRVGRGLTAAANLVANDVLPLTWAIDMVHGNANSATYTVAALYTE